MVTSGSISTLLLFIYIITLHLLMKLVIVKYRLARFIQVQYSSNDGRASDWTSYKMMDANLMAKDDE